MVVLGMSSVIPQSKADFSVLPCKGHNSCLSFRCQSPHWVSASYGFHSVDPGCLECSCLRTDFLSFMGSANIKHSSMTDKESLHRLNCGRSPVRSGAHECLRNLQTFCIIGLHLVSCLISTHVTGIVRIQLMSARWKLSSILMATMTVLSSGTNCKLMRCNKASTCPTSAVLRCGISKSYPKIIAQCCIRLADVIFWVVGEKCVWLQNKERIDTHNNTVMML